MISTSGMYCFGTFNSNCILFRMQTTTDCGRRCHTEISNAYETGKKQSLNQNRLLTVTTWLELRSHHTPMLLSQEQSYTYSETHEIHGVWPTFLTKQENQTNTNVTITVKQRSCTRWIELRRLHSYRKSTTRHCWHQYACNDTHLWLELTSKKPIANLVCENHIEFRILIELIE